MWTTCIDSPIPMMCKTSHYYRVYNLYVHRPAFEPFSPRSRVPGHNYQSHYIFDEYNDVTSICAEWIMNYPQYWHHLRQPNRMTKLSWQNVIAMPHLLLLRSEVRLYNLDVVSLATLAAPCKTESMLWKPEQLNKNIYQVGYGQSGTVVDDNPRA